MDYKVKPPPEWEKIAAQAKNDSQLTLLVKAWLESNRTSAVAGAVLSKLIETIGKEDTDIVEESALWLQDHYADDAASVLIGQMLESSYSDRFVSFAKQCLRSPKKLRQLRPLIQAVQDGVIHGELFEVVGELLEQNPFDNDWQHGLRYWQDSKLAEDLVCRWIALNQNNPRMSLLRHSTGAHSPAVIEACFNWLLGGGHDPFSLAFVIESARKSHRAVLDDVVGFAREWLDQHQESEYAGYIYGEIVVSTELDSDIANARAWLEGHLDSRSAHSIQRRLESL